MYIVTGGAGFIGSAFARKLNDQGIDEILIVDELASTERWKNLVKIRYADYLHKDAFMELIARDKFPSTPKAIIHMGACSSTVEQNADFMMENNYRCTKILADYAVRNDIQFLYASSAATYGDGANGYVDDEDKLESLRPLNIYGYSKQIFDAYANRNDYFSKITGLKFFNVFGPNEYHKEGMRSVVMKAHAEIQEHGQVRLFKSYRTDFKDGEQKRDFVYVKDCIEIMWWLLNNPDVTGLFNLGSGKARSWNDLANSVFAAMKKTPAIEYIEMPETLQKQYQYFTEAEMSKLEKAGCPITCRSLEDSVADYVLNHLERADPYL